MDKIKGEGGGGGGRGVQLGWGGRMGRKGIQLQLNNNKNFFKVKKKYSNTRAHVKLLLISLEHRFSAAGLTGACDPALKEVLG